ncbi:heavy metal-associated isoprenylated plant protein 35 [Fagus crenata]
MSCSLKVDTQSPGWDRTLIKVLKSIKGLSYNIDVEEGVAHIRGKIDPKQLLKKLRKAGRKAELLEVHSHDPYENNDHIMYGRGYESCHNYPSYNYGRPMEPSHQYPYYPSHDPRYYGSGYYEPRTQYPRYRQYEPMTQYSYYQPFEPPAQRFPQPPSPMKIHPLYDPHYPCSIM